MWPFPSIASLEEIFTLPHTTTIHCSGLTFVSRGWSGLGRTALGTVCSPKHEEVLFLISVHFIPGAAGFNCGGWLMATKGLKVRTVTQARSSPVAYNQFAEIFFFSICSLSAEAQGTPVILLLYDTSSASFRSNEAKQKGIFFQWFALST